MFAAATDSSMLLIPMVTTVAKSLFTPSASAIAFDSVPPAVWSPSVSRIISGFPRDDDAAWPSSYSARSIPHEMHVSTPGGGGSSALIAASSTCRSDVTQPRSPSPSSSHRAHRCGFMSQICPGKP